MKENDISKIIIIRADEVIDTLKNNNVSAVLSIEHPGVIEGRVGFAPRIKEIPQNILTFWDTENKEISRAPDVDQVNAGIIFALEHIEKGDVIIHCNAGKARSTALALGVLALMNVKKSTDDLIKELLEIRPIAAPNILIVEMVDQIAGRNGKLLQAVKKHKGISEQRRQAELAREMWAERNPEKLAAFKWGVKHIVPS